MRHPTDGTLRRLLDEPAGVPDADREHVAGCKVCLAGLAAARADADFAGAALHSTALPDATLPDATLPDATLPNAALHGAGLNSAGLNSAALHGAGLNGGAGPDVDAAWQRLSRAVADDRPAPVTTAARGRRWRTAVRSPVVAGVAAVALLAGAGAAAATDWLQVLRTERIAPVTISQADLVALPDLSSWGELRITEKPRIREVAGADAAAQATGLGVPRVGGLPRGVTGEPAYQVGDRISATFTFSAAKAARWATSAGQTAPPAPPGLDGSRFRLTAGPGVAAVWSSRAGGIPNLIVARAVAPSAYSSGVPFAAARDYLLSLSGLPEDVAAQLRRFTGDGTTLPLQVLSEELTSRPADVGGAPATVLTSRDGVLAGVVWVRDGAVTAVAGSLSADEVLTVARGLRWDR